jgi:hypothetical protein
LIYRGERMINWCPKDQTALSNIEVEHREIEWPVSTLCGIRWPKAPLYEGKKYLYSWQRRVPKRFSATRHLRFILRTSVTPHLKGAKAAKFRFINKLIPVHVRRRRRQGVRYRGRENHPGA